MELVNRVSTFILLVGIALLGLFMLSVFAEETQLILLVAGIILIGLSVFLNKRFPGPEKPRAERFRLMKKKASAPKSDRTGGQAGKGRRNQGRGSGKRNEKKDSDQQERQ